MDQQFNVEASVDVSIEIVLELLECYETERSVDRCTCEYLRDKGRIRDGWQMELTLCFRSILQTYVLRKSSVLARRQYHLPGGKTLRKGRWHTSSNII